MSLVVLVSSNGAEVPFGPPQASMSSGPECVDVHSGDSFTYVQAFYIKRRGKLMAQLILLISMEISHALFGVNAGYFMGTEGL